MCQSQCRQTFVKPLFIGEYCGIERIAIKNEMYRRLSFGYHLLIKLRVKRDFAVSFLCFVIVLCRDGVSFDGIRGICALFFGLVGIQLHGWHIGFATPHVARRERLSLGYNNLVSYIVELVELPLL